MNANRSTLKPQDLPVAVDLPGQNFSLARGENWVVSLGAFALHGDTLLGRLSVTDKGSKLMESEFAFADQPVNPDGQLEGTVMCRIQQGAKTRTVQCGASGFRNGALDGTIHHDYRITLSVPKRRPDSTTFFVSWPRYPESAECSVRITKEQLQRSQ